MTIVEKPPKYYTIEELKKLFSTAISHNYRDYVMFLCLFQCGRRISELLRLRSNDIDVENDRIKWSISKRRREYYEWFNTDSSVIKALTRYCSAMGIKGDSLVFPITRYRVNQLVEKYRKIAGIPKIKGRSIHALRHSFAVHYVQSGNTDIESLMKLKELMGHININSTMFYLQFSKERHRKELAKMPKLAIEVDKNESN